MVITTLPVRLSALLHTPAHTENSRNSFPRHTSKKRARKSFTCHTFFKLKLRVPFRNATAASSRSLLSSL